MLIFVVRVTAKTICSVVLPPALRVAHDSFGLILPRRHYSSAATEGTAQPSRSYIPAALRRAASPTPQQASSRRRAGSLERTKIRFTLGDGATLPVPFTHPGTHLPGDSLADRMAGAISSEEKERQRNVEESGLKFERPEDRHAEQVRHYDADGEFSPRAGCPEAHAALQCWQRSSSTQPSALPQRVRSRCSSRTSVCANAAVEPGTWCA
jgi:hypothetical protein